MAIEQLAWGLAIGGVAGALVAGWWRQKIENERAIPERWYRHKITGALYEEICIAAPADSPMERHRILHTTVKMFDRDESRKEIWTEDNVRRVLESTDPPWVDAARSQKSN